MSRHILQAPTPAERAASRRQQAPILRAGSVPGVFRLELSWGSEEPLNPFSAGRGGRRAVCVVAGGATCTGPPVRGKRRREPMALVLPDFLLPLLTLRVGSGPVDWARQCGKLIANKKVEREVGRQTPSAGTLKPLNRRAQPRSSVTPDFSHRKIIRSCNRARMGKPRPMRGAR